MRQRLRQRAGSESGFTLVELLVVMLILGILMAIAIPSFIGQKSKGSDSQAKAAARTMQTAMETCATDNLGAYDGCSLDVLRAIEPTIPPAPDAVSAPGFWGVLPYLIGAKSSTGNWFYIYREADGDIVRICSVPAGSDRGGCLAGNTW